MAEGSEPETLTIRLEPGANPIGGVVIGASGETPFSGWIELAGLIESAHARTIRRAPAEREKFVDPPR